MNCLWSHTATSHWQAKSFLASEAILMLQRQSHLCVWYDHVANPPGDYTKVHGKHEAE